MNKLIRLIIIVLIFHLGGIHNLLFSQNQTVHDSVKSEYLDDTLRINIGEVVITGPRVSKRIIDIPYSVTRLEYYNFQYDKKISVSDVLSSVPGMFLQSRYGNHDVRISIRGFGSKSKSGIRGVRILLDDIPESEPDGQTRIEAIDFNSIGSIEIAKGNLSSLYTNAPGGVINFINDISFKNTFVKQFNHFGSFGLQRVGFKAGIRTKNYGLLTTFSNHNYSGYRDHNTEHWNIVNTVVETASTENSSLKILFYFADGEIKLPGSLTKEEFESNPYQAEKRAVERDTKRLSTKGRLGIRYNTTFGKKLNNEFELTTYATVKYFERTNKEFRIINRNGFGLRTRFMNISKIGNAKNEFIVGNDILFQPARIEYYANINGTKGDQILQLLNEKIYNTGYYFSNNFELVDNELFLMLTGRYDNITFKLEEETLPSRNNRRNFSAFVPKVALNYKISKWISAYSSFGYSYDSPAKNELDSFDPSVLYNNDLKPQETRSLELGIKGFVDNNKSPFIKRIQFELTLFSLRINNEIVPYEVYGDVFFRNAAITNRNGVEFGSSFSIIKDLDFKVSYTYSNFVYNSYSALSIKIDSAGNIVESEKDYSGKVVPSVPKNNIFMSLSYSKPISKPISIYGKVSYHGVSGLWVDDANSDKTKPYNLLNSVVGLDMNFGKLNIMLSAGMNNVFDEIYVGFTNTNSAESRYYEAGEPRSYFANLNFGYVF